MAKNRKTTAATIQSFNFVAAADAQVLILGSMPGVASLGEGQYYAHPQNQFWPIIEALFPHSSKTSSDLYQKRLQVIRDNKIALWDVLAECERPGSLDSNINNKTILLNDFASLFAYAPEIKAIFFNGKTAEKLFKRHFLSQNRDLLAAFALIGLPSTSPAYAKMRHDEKLSHWKSIKTYINKPSTCG